MTEVSEYSAGRDNPIARVGVWILDRTVVRSHTLIKPVSTIIGKDARLTAHRIAAVGAISMLLEMRTSRAAYDIQV